MSLKAQIENAIGAHGLWKSRLRNAIKSGQSEFDPAVVASDTDCMFGKWLYQEISPEQKQTSNYATIKKLHADFHKLAGKILNLALSGKIAEAEQSLGQGSEFVQLSTKLTGAMVDWKKTVPLN